MAINRENIVTTFKNYTDRYDAQDPKVRLKIDHTYRVAQFCDKIAESLQMTEEERDFAWLSGMLHDIGRFEQLRRYHTFQDKYSVNHAALSAELLFGEGLIRDYADEGEIDYKRMEKVIRYHNVLALPEKQDETERIFCNILRDADKVDILRVNCETPRTEIYDLTDEEFENSLITDEVYEDVMAGRNVDRKNSKTGIDFILGHIAFAFGVVFDESIRLIREQGYLQQLLDFQSRNEETAKKLAVINGRVNAYIDARIN